MLGKRRSLQDSLARPRGRQGFGIEYIIRASFSQERMNYLEEESKVLYQSKGGKMEKTFDGLEWLAAMTSHVLNRPGWLQWFQYLLWTLCFSRAKNLRFEDHIYLLPPPLVGVRYGKILSLLKAPKTPIIGVVPY